MPCINQSGETATPQAIAQSQPRLSKGMGKPNYLDKGDVKPMRPEQFPPNRRRVTTQKVHWNAF
jgi:hypothetical protein